MVKKNKNWNCDGDNCLNSNGEIRVLPTGGGSNLLLCQECFEHEMVYRRARNRELSKDCQFKILKWEELKIYDPS